MTFSLTVCDVVLQCLAHCVARCYAPPASKSAHFGQQPLVGEDGCPLHMYIQPYQTVADTPFDSRAKRRRLRGHMTQHNWYYA